MINDQSCIAYLKALERSLRGLSLADRGDIVRQIESHVADRTAQGAHSEEILARLGNPDDLARAYLDQNQLYCSIADPSPSRLLGAIFSSASRNVANFAVGLLGMSLFVLCASFFVIAAAKLIAPWHVGYWNSPTGMDLGIIPSPPANSRELLGFWIVPIALIASATCYVAAIAILRRRAAWLIKHSSPLSDD